jgi:hypothetical protein
MLGIHLESTWNFRNFWTHILLFEVLLHSTGIHPDSPESGESDRNMWGTVKHCLLGRLLNRPFDDDEQLAFSPQQRNSVRIIDDRIYSSKVLQVNYTTYDVRRDQDSMNP